MEWWGRGVINALDDKNKQCAISQEKIFRKKYKNDAQKEAIENCPTHRLTYKTIAQ